MINLIDSFRLAFSKQYPFACGEDQKRHNSEKGHSIFGNALQPLKAMPFCLVGMLFCLEGMPFCLLLNIKKGKKVFKKGMISTSGLNTSFHTNLFSEMRYISIVLSQQIYFYSRKNNSYIRIRYSYHMVTTWSPDLNMVTRGHKLVTMWSQDDHFFGYRKFFGHLYGH